MSEMSDKCRKCRKLFPIPFRLFPAYGFPAVLGAEAHENNRSMRITYYCFICTIFATLFCKMLIINID